MNHLSSAVATLLAALTLMVAPAIAGESESNQSRSANGSTITVYRSPTCGCCGSWIEHLRKEGFTVNDKLRDDMTAIKDRYGVPDKARSCHTAVIDGYVIEGHVPAADIRQVLAQRPAIKGLAVPGMVVGSPGMEAGNRKDPYSVVSIETDGNLRVFRNYIDY